MCYICLKHKLSDTCTERIWEVLNNYVQMKLFLSNMSVKVNHVITLYLSPYKAAPLALQDLACLLLTNYGVWNKYVPKNTISCFIHSIYITEYCLTKFWILPLFLILMILYLCFGIPTWTFVLMHYVHNTYDNATPNQIKDTPCYPRIRKLVVKRTTRLKSTRAFF